MYVCLEKKKRKASTNILMFTPDYGCCLCSLLGFFIFSILSTMNSYYFCNEKKKLCETELN